MIYRKGNSSYLVWCSVKEEILKHRQKELQCTGTYANHKEFISYQLFKILFDAIFFNHDVFETNHIFIQMFILKSK